MPKKCPKGGFLIKTELIFDEGGAVPAVPEVVPATYKSPCPKKLSGPCQAAARGRPRPVGRRARRAGMRRRWHGGRAICEHTFA